MHVARYMIIIDYLLIGGYVPRQGHLGSINIYIVIFKWEKKSKKLAVKDFGKIVLKNQLGILLAVIVTSYFKILKMPTIFEIFVNIVIQKLLCTCYQRRSHKPLLHPWLEKLIPFLWWIPYVTLSTLINSTPVWWGLRKTYQHILYQTLQLLLIHCWLHWDQLFQHSSPWYPAGLRIP